MSVLRRCRVWSLLLGLLLAAGCTVQVAYEEITPTAEVLPSAQAAATVRRPATLPPREPTPCASGRVAGKVCLAWADVSIRSCCPPWEATTTSDGGGGFAFESLTVGTFTVTVGAYSRRVTLETCESQVNVDLCPPASP